MSEAMSSVEIEDVLSSIRRLVSEDLRPSPSLGPRPSAAPRPEAKLLLTPALRVVGDKDSSAAAVAVAAPPARPKPVPRLHLGAEPVIDPKVIDPTVATLERAVDTQDIEWESEVGDPVPLIGRMAWTDEGWAAVAEISAATCPPEAEIQPWAQTDPDQDTESFAPDPDDLEPELRKAGPDDPRLEPSKPDHSDADRAEAEAVAELRQDERIETVATFNDEMIFDEAVLRELVRDIIREELQGGLGARITRNVRKLVRAEIARALATQDLE